MDVVKPEFERREIVRTRLSSLLIAASMVAVLAAPVAAITFGTVDVENRYSNVGGLIFEADGEFFLGCTGTLIAPTVFLTAAHCVAPGERVLVTFDPSIDPSSTMLPGTARPHPDFACCGASDTFDIAVVLLDAPVSGITPASLPRLNQLGQLSSRALKDATFVTAGYGVVRDDKGGGWKSLRDSEGLRSYVSQTVNSMTKAWLNLSMNPSTGNGGTCYGDSGGPHFLGATVVSITVTGDRWCRATDKTYRVDTAVARDFLDEFVTLP